MASLVLVLFVTIAVEDKVRVKTDLLGPEAMGLDAAPSSSSSSGEGTNITVLLPCEATRIPGLPLRPNESTGILDILGLQGLVRHGEV